MRVRAYDRTPVVRRTPHQSDTICIVRLRSYVDDGVSLD